MILLTWNPDDGKAWPINEYEKDRKNSNQGKIVELPWSVANRVNIDVGTECYLLIQGKKYPRGLIARGITTSVPEKKDHWLDKRKKCYYVDVNLEELLPIDDVIPISILDLKVPEVPWIPKKRGWIQSSGYSVPENSQELLRKVWSKHSSLSKSEYSDDEILEEFYEGESRQVYINRYERDPMARKACLNHYGLKCFACEIDLSRVYGKELGARAIHVHHVTPMSIRGGKSYKIDPIKDLIPLCPNCHNVIHKTNPIMTPESFRREILKK